jgi:eukaryotic-like serine/threonine-protein kinase
MASLESGKRLADRYVLQERLGDGGHAEVWAALDEQTSSRVALKFMHLRSCSADEAMLVLRHEAQMVRRLQHPGVLRVDEPQRDGWLVFLPLEYAGGGDASRLRGAPWQKVLPMLLQVAQVLEHAHSRGVVHRDIKPGNVLFDDSGAVRVTDFGTASRMGSTAAMSAGSPFSASPQQLSGDAATTADDVYGLGALAYELLTRYPPFYPDFDLQRVQREDPPRPVPEHAAPAELINLVQAMLSRKAEDRPDLQQAMQGFRHCLETGEPAPEIDAGLVIEPARSAAPVAQVRRSAGALWWLAAAAGIGGVAYLLLTHLPSTPVTPKAVVAVVPATVADAVIARDAPRVATAASAPAVAVTTLPEALAAANAALKAGQPAIARAALQRAQVLDPGNAEASRQMQAVSALEHLLTEFAAATRVEAGGDMNAARAKYQALLAKRPDFAPVRDALARVQARVSADEFEQHLARGAAALRLGKLDDAEAAYASAAVMNADEPRVLDGKARIAEVQRNQRNADDLARGASLENSEQWTDAIAHYQSVLARDASLLFAQDGLGRSTRRAALDAELADYLARPDRLSAAAVRNAAERALARSDAASPQSRRLVSQTTQLRAALQALGVPVRVAISSDNSTEISMAPMGQLGAFRLRELDLAPGRYTVIGRRDGFRDVRVELNIVPGQHDASLSVQCTERI